MLARIRHRQVRLADAVVLDAAEGHERLRLRHQALDERTLADAGFSGVSASSTQTRRIGHAADLLRSFQNLGDVIGTESRP